MGVERKVDFLGIPIRKKSVAYPHSEVLSRPLTSFGKKLLHANARNSMWDSSTGDFVRKYVAAKVLSDIGVKVEEGEYRHVWKTTSEVRRGGVLRRTFSHFPLNTTSKIVKSPEEGTVYVRGPRKWNGTRVSLVAGKTK